VKTVQDENKLRISALEAEVASLRELLDTYEEMVAAQSRDLERLLSEQRERAEQLAALAEELRRAKEAAEVATLTQEEAAQQLREANAQLSQELAQRERAEAAQVALQAKIVAVHRERLLELSAPLIPILDGILVMPLVGTMDVERASQAVETALRGAAESGAAFLIIDITGVKMVDETVANMLLQATSGLKLLGTQAIITGIRPMVAQTLVQHAFSLDTLVTKGTLQAGVQHALRAHGGRISLSR
jgi:anti-anti-sigma regulatory factor